MAATRKTSEERIAAARARMAASDVEREQGGTFFRDGVIQTALLHYHRAHLQLKGLVQRQSASSMPMGPGDPLPDDIAAEVTGLEVRVLNNMALCLSKLGKTERVVEVCKDILAMAPNDPKANFRLGSVYLAKDDVDRAEPMLQIALDANPTDGMVVAAMKSLAAKRAKLDKAQANLFGGWADRKE
eukprot:c39284_g1_i1.p2 GENE.c39284_g1_i1~~c39284_g1_i1.p2  ORF type:complete len:196 (-),score=42.49 c39284_g1_i1:211-768(-)